MSEFVPEKDVLRRSLITFRSKETTPESCRLLVEAYSEHGLTLKNCERWFKCHEGEGFDIKK